MLVFSIQSPAVWWVCLSHQPVSEFLQLLCPVLCPQRLSPSAMSKWMTWTHHFAVGPLWLLSNTFLFLSWVCSWATLSPSTRVIALPWGLTDRICSTLKGLKAIVTTSQKVLNQPFPLTKVVVKYQNCNKTLTLSKSNEFWEEFSFSYKLKGF